jgi:uncharacterized membrane protein
MYFDTGSYDNIADITAWIVLLLITPLIYYAIRLYQKRVETRWKETDGMEEMGVNMKDLLHNVVIVLSVASFLFIAYISYIDGSLDQEVILEIASTVIIVILIVFGAILYQVRKLRKLEEEWQEEEEERGANV